MALDFELPKPEAAAVQQPEPTNLQLFIGMFIFTFLVIAVGYGLYSMYSWISNLNVHSASSDSHEPTADASAPDYDTAQIQIGCDTLARRSLRNPSSYSPGWGNKVVETSNVVIVAQNFTASNDFGGTLDSYYLCIFDVRKSKLKSFDIVRGHLDY